MPAGSSGNFLDLDPLTGDLVRYKPLIQSAGGGSAGMIIALGPDGKIDATMLPSASGGGAGTVESIVTTEALVAGDFITIYSSNGNRRVRKALASDRSRQAHGYVIAPANQNTNATVYSLDGVNAYVALQGFIAGDEGKPVFLSRETAGGVTKDISLFETPAIIQRLGIVLEITSNYVRVLVDPIPQIVRL